MRSLTVRSRTLFRLRTQTDEKTRGEEWRVEGGRGACNTGCCTRRRLVLGTAKSRRSAWKHPIWSWDRPFLHHLGLGRPCKRGSEEPPLRTTVKTLKMTEIAPPVVVCVHREKTHAAEQCIIDTRAAMSMEVHQSHVLQGGATSGRTAISIREIPSPAPNRRENLIFRDHHKKEPPNSTISKVVETEPTTEVLLAVCRWGWRNSGSVSQGCGNNTSFCSDNGVILARWGGGGDPDPDPEGSSSLQMKSPRCLWHYSTQCVIMPNQMRSARGTQRCGPQRKKQRVTVQGPAFTMVPPVWSTPSCWWFCLDA